MVNCISVICSNLSAINWSNHGQAKMSRPIRDYQTLLGRDISQYFSKSLLNYLQPPGIIPAIPKPITSAGISFFTPERCRIGIPGCQTKSDLRKSISSSIYLTGLWLKSSMSLYIYPHEFLIELLNLVRIFSVSSLPFAFSTMSQIPSRLTSRSAKFLYGDTTK